jgi:CRP-like cAMP-binding protein
MARSNRQAEYLSTVPLFSALSKSDLRSVVKASDDLDVFAGRELVTEGQPGREFFLILEGTATVRRRGRKVATLGPGQFFGELSLLDRGARSATVEAATNLRLLVLDRQAFMGLLESVPGFAAKLLVGMAQRLREADNRAITH